MLRRFAAFLIAFAWLAGCGGRASGPVNPIPPNSSQTVPQRPPTNVNELPEPPVVKSVNGVAKVRLQVTFSGATGFPQFVFNGFGGVAPTIRVNPGDRIEMSVADDLLPRKGEKDNINIHFHGLGSSPRPPGDDVLGTMARPGPDAALCRARSQEPRAGTLLVPSARPRPDDLSSWFGRHVGRDYRQRPRASSAGSGKDERAHDHRARHRRW